MHCLQAGLLTPRLLFFFWFASLRFLQWRRRKEQRLPQIDLSKRDRLGSKRRMRCRGTTVPRDAPIQEGLGSFQNSFSRRPLLSILPPDISLMHLAAHGQSTSGYMMSLVKRGSHRTNTLFPPIFLMSKS
ncbi:unnamed protein product [Ectocarpus sp. 12 AP-2014]